MRPALWGVVRRAHHDPDYAQRARRLLYPGKLASEKVRMLAVQWI